MLKSHFDRLYYDIEIPYRPNSYGFSAAVFQQQLNQVLIQNPNDYSVAITRFNIPTSRIPIFVAEIQPFPNTDPDNTIYSVAIGYNGAFSPETFVQYQTSTLSIPTPPNLTVDNPNQQNSPYYYVYTYQIFLH